MDYRIEKDTIGEIKVPIYRYWGAQTERSYENFPIGEEKMPKSLIRAMAVLKQATAIANNRYGKLDNTRCELIKESAQKIISGQYSEEFPLSVWQTGSGTQSNMNMNEVISHIGNEIYKEEILHPNDHVNMSQSSNDVFPSSMHIAAYKEIKEVLLPSLNYMKEVLIKLEKENEGIVKIGRTHLQDATPIKFSQEIMGWRGMIESSINQIEITCDKLRYIPIGGTAVGTGINAPEGYGNVVTEILNDLTGLDFISEENKFYSLTSKDSFVFSHGALKALAGNLMKLGNDIRWLASGPRCGIGEISIPANEPGSSIMPGKINPTQVEALTMVAVQVMGNDTSIGIASSQGNFELNVYMPIIIYNFMQSVNLLSDAINSFTKRCLEGIKINLDRMNFLLNNSLMLVTALSPILGYEKSAYIAKKAFEENTSLKDVVLRENILTEEEFDKIINPKNMI